MSTPVLDTLHPRARAAILQALLPGEVVEAAVTGDQGWALVATDRRVLTAKWGEPAGTWRGREQAYAWHYEQVLGLQDARLEIGRDLVLLAVGTNPVTFGLADTGIFSVWQAPNAIWVDASSPLVDAQVAAVQAAIDWHRPPSAGHAG